MFGVYKKSDGFVVAFENGWAVSVRFGLNMFSSTKFEEECDEEMRMCTSPDAELALIFKGEIFGNVFSSVTTEAYSMICGYVARVPSLQDPAKVYNEVRRLSENRAGWQTSPIQNS